MHARVEGMLSTETGATNVDRLAGDKADGGWSKIFTAAKMFVDNTSDSTIFLDGGDMFQGTIWHTYVDMFGARVPARSLTNRLGDAVTIEAERRTSS